MKDKILIIGKIPPPIGGVRVHVFRLIEHLLKNGYDRFHFYNLQKETVIDLLSKIPHYSAVHLHTSNPYLQLVVALYARTVKTKLIITYHGNLGRFDFLKNLVSKFSIYLAIIPLVQNHDSFIRATRWNKFSRLMSAFIPPTEILPLSYEILRIVSIYRKRYKYLFCTNASNITFDKNGNEIYGIAGLIKNISQARHSALIISDPTGGYKKYIEKRILKLPENVLFITVQHEFYGMLQISDAFIRNTTTDGDSISIHEAIHYGKIVFASDCVSRPAACHLFHDISKIDFEVEMASTTFNSAEQNRRKATNVVEELTTIYDKLILEA